MAQLSPKSNSPFRNHTLRTLEIRGQTDSSLTRKTCWSEIKHGQDKVWHAINYLPELLSSKDVRSLFVIEGSLQKLLGRPVCLRLPEGVWMWFSLRERTCDPVSVNVIVDWPFGFPGKTEAVSVCSVSSSVNVFQWSSSVKVFHYRLVWIYFTISNCECISLSPSVNVVHYLLAWMCFTMY